MIISFYSYKGGVGRSQLCANIAAYLCHKKGKKVLLWDWDFEAPGLHYFFGVDDTSIKNTGTIEMLEHYSNMMRTTPIVTKEDYDFIPSKAIISLKEGETYKGKKGKIDLFPGGNYNDNFTAKVNNFNWYEFYELLDGKVYIESLKDKLKSLDYDYILIDSRTGINDYSGICNLQLPDANVVVMAANSQNMNGCKRIIDQIRNHDYIKSGHRKPYIFPILSRINVNHPKFQNWSDKFANYFHELIYDWEPDLENFFLKEIFCDFYLDKTLLEDDPQFSAGENILTHNRKQVFPRGSLGAKYASIGDYLENITLYDNINLSNQIDKETWVNYAENIAEEDKQIAYAYEKANEFDKSIKYGGTANVFFRKGNQSFVKGNKNIAIEFYEKAIEMSPDFYDALVYLASTYDDIGRMDKAIEYYKKAIDINPNKYEAFNNMGSTYFKKGDMDEAIEYYKKAIDIKPDSHIAITNIGSAYHDKSDVDKAIEYFKKAIDIKPDSHIAISNLGVAYHDKSDVDKALDCYKKAINIKPDYYQALNNTGIAYNTKGDIDRAIEYYKKAVDIKPDYYQVFNNIGSAYAEKGDINKSIEHYKKAIDINPNNPNAYVNLGFSLIRSGRIGKSKAILEKGIFLGGVDLGNMNLGHFYLLTNKETNAIKHYLKSLNAFSDKNSFWEGMNDDLQYLIQYGITKERYDLILQKIKEKESLS